MSTCYPHIESTMPILLIGAGGIVRTAHLPAYQLASYAIAGVFDIDQNKAHALASDFSIPTVYASIGAAVSAHKTNVIYDVAVPGSAVLDVIRQLPDGATVLIQKPMGEDLAQARQILALARTKGLKAGVNFQLRYAPAILALKRMIAEGRLGEINDIEINVNVYTPWNLWPFLFAAPRVEILYHSIHYIDLVRTLLGDPRSVMAKTIRHPQMQELSSVKTAIILDHGDLARATILTNHCHNYGEHHQHSYIKVEGTLGAVKIELGVLKNYPAGAEDRFEFIEMKDPAHAHWQHKHIEGSWFPHAFIGSMDQMMRVAIGDQLHPDNTVEDCIKTMACVEAAYRSSMQGGEKPEYS